jgi:glycosyltransferase involved in cell wall biosynthesis
MDSNSLEEAVIRLGIVSTHPIQYYAPWFQQLAQERNLVLKVFYLWDFGVKTYLDRGFQQAIQWDIPLLSGYDSVFIPNTSTDPGTHHFLGIKNPTLTKQVRAFGPDAVVLIGYNYLSLYQFLYNWQTLQVPLIFRGDSHRLIERKGVEEWLRRQFLRILFQQFSACLYVGESNKKYFRYHGVPEERLFFAPHAVNNDFFFSKHESAHVQSALWKQELGIPESHLVILFAGKFEEKKRPLDLLQAFINSRLENAVLLFVGAGSLETEMRMRATGHANIIFAPFQNQSQMPRVYEIGDIFVLPSYGSDETWGLAINEAMCMARPVIVSTHVGCFADLVQNGRNGLVFPAGDMAALEDCLKEACADRERLHRWGNEGQAIIQNYSYTQATVGLKQALTFLNGHDK